MKIKLSFVVLAVALYGIGGISPVLAHAGADHSDTSATVPQSAEGEGVVNAVDPDGGTIKLEHGPIAALNWPAMTMTFKVESSAVLSGVNVGDSVHFVLKNQDGKPVVAEIHAK